MNSQPESPRNLPMQDEASSLVKFDAEECSKQLYNLKTKTMKHFFSYVNLCQPSDCRKSVALCLLMFFACLSLRAEVITLENADFEQWNDSIPVAWYGETSNIDSSAVVPSEDAYAGKYACRLIKTQKTHARFSSHAFPLKAGYYQLSYYAKGEGDIRNSYYKGSSYDAYSEYVSLSGNEWKKIDYVFQVKSDLKAVELIFSVASTSKEGVLIDALSLQTTEKPNALEAVSMQHLTFATQEGKLLVEAYQPCRLQLYDVLGQMLVQEELQQGSTSFDLERGVYLMRVNEAEAVQKISIH